jgi:hypothetical protein
MPLNNYVTLTSVVICPFEQKKQTTYPVVYRIREALDGGDGDGIVSELKLNRMILFS